MIPCMTRQDTSIQVPKEARERVAFWKGYIAHSVDSNDHSKTELLSMARHELAHAIKDVELSNIALPGTAVRIRVRHAGN